MAENVPVNVHIRRNADGAERVYPFPQHGWDADNCDFIWSEGNYACDCNRHLFFCRAESEDEDDDIACGHTAYSVCIFNLSGARLYADDDWDAPK